VTRILPEEEKSESTLSTQEELENRDQQHIYRVWQYSMKLRRQTVGASRVN